MGFLLYTHSGGVGWGQAGTTIEMFVKVFLVPYPNIIFSELNDELVNNGHLPIKHSFDIWHFTKVSYESYYEGCMHPWSPAGSSGQ